MSVGVLGWNLGFVNREISRLNRPAVTLANMRSRVLHPMRFVSRLTAWSVTFTCWTICALAAVTATAPGTPALEDDASVGGVWNLEFTTPNGPIEFSMGLIQDGRRVTGHVTSDLGDFGVTGSVNGREVTLRFQLPEQGKAIDIVLTATVTGNQMRGTAQVGASGSGKMSAERTES